MKVTIIKLLTVLISTPGGCTAESLKRTGYETLQNIGEMQCESELSSECGKRVRYDDYQKKAKI